MRNISVNVSKKILADVSSGIYRTPANALKELVSNAFDAGATSVYISTNIPYFDVFTAEDNGEGISPKEFENILNRIGSSKKRLDGNDSIYSRPIIGKIGIGLLAIAQICHKFTIISKKSDSEKYFQATLDFRQFDDIEHEFLESNKDKKIKLGTCQIEDDLLDEVDSKAKYTKVIMEDIKKGFNKKLIQENTKTKFGIKEKAKTCEAIINFIEDVKNKEYLRKLSQYDQLMWELCLNCPVEYLDGEPIPENETIKTETKKLKKYDFKVFVDGFELRKPIFFPTDIELTDPELDYKIYPPLKFDKEVGNSQLKFTGYVYHQRTRILPAELRGLLIRIKGIAVGPYDRSLFNYPKSEGPMGNQISGEIFVEKGLEEALNIDRNSFNESHPHFLKLQEYVWNYLGGEEGIFKDIRKRSKIRNDKRHKVESSSELVYVLEEIEKMFGYSMSYKRNNEKEEYPYRFNQKHKTLDFFENKFWSNHKKKRLEQEKIVIKIISAKQISNSLDDFEKNLVSIFSKK